MSSDLVHFKEGLPVLPFGREFQSVATYKKWNLPEDSDRVPYLPGLDLVKKNILPMYNKLLGKKRDLSKIFHGAEITSPLKQVPHIYDKDGLPINPDGSDRPFTIEELQMMEQSKPQPASMFPKRLRHCKRKNKKKRNPANKVDIEKLFMEELRREDDLVERN